jgi:4-amino-4-deoxy-L-arabinose transferase-like glycosyltransferase
VFGPNEAAVRIPPLLFGLFGMIAVAALGRALFDEVTGLASGIAYGTMLLPLAVSQVAVHDIGLIGFMCAACWCMLPISQPLPEPGAEKGRQTVLLTALAGLCLGLSILTKGLVGVVFTGIFAACLAVSRPAALRRLAIALTVAGIIAALVAAPWYIAMERAHPGYLHYYFIERHLQGYLTATQRHAGRPFWYYVPILIGGSLPWTAYVVVAARSARRSGVGLMIWGWLAIGLLFLSIGESKLVTYALPLFPALAILAGSHVAATTSSRGLIAHVTTLALLPALGLIALRWKFGADASLTGWILVILFAVATMAAGLQALRASAPDRSLSWIAVMSICALAGMMVVSPRLGEWMTSRDLAAALNRGGTLPSRVSVLDERIGSLVFYLDPPLRAEASRERLEDASFAEAIARARVDPDDAVLAVRLGQLPRFNRLFPSPPAPDERAGTFALFRAATLRRALAPQAYLSK